MKIFWKGLTVAAMLPYKCLKGKRVCNEIQQRNAVQCIESNKSTKLKVDADSFSPCNWANKRVQRAFEFSRITISNHPESIGHEFIAFQIGFHQRFFVYLFCDQQGFGVVHFSLDAISRQISACTKDYWKHFFPCNVLTLHSKLESSWTCFGTAIFVEHQSNPSQPNS